MPTSMEYCCVKHNGTANEAADFILNKESVEIFEGNVFSDGWTLWISQKITSI